MLCWQSVNIIDPGWNFTSRCEESGRERERERESERERERERERNIDTERQWWDRDREGGERNQIKTKWKQMCVLMCGRGWEKEREEWQRER